MANQGTDSYIQLKEGEWENLNRALRYIYNQLDALSGVRTLGPSPSHTYQPVVTNAYNYSTVSVTESQYLRVGNTIIVFGSFSATPVTPAVLSKFEISLPVDPRFAKSYQGSGVAFASGVAGQGAALYGNVANGTAQVAWTSANVTAQDWSYIFAYAVP